MADSLHRINVPALGNTYGENIKETFNNIDANFGILGNEDLNRGPKGDSLISLNIPFKELLKDSIIDPDTGDEYISYDGYRIEPQKENIKSAFEKLKYDITGETIQPDDSDVALVMNALGSSELNVVICFDNPDNPDVIVTIKTILPVVFIDQRFWLNNYINNISSTTYDLSCTMRMDVDDSNPLIPKWICTQTFPTLYYKPTTSEEDRSNTFFWRINGENTDIPARGPAGQNGSNGTLYVGTTTTDPTSWPRGESSVAIEIDQIQRPYDMVLGGQWGAAYDVYTELTRNGQQMENSPIVILPTNRDQILGSSNPDDKYTYFLSTLYPDVANNKIKATISSNNYLITKLDQYIFNEVMLACAGVNDLSETSSSVIIRGYTIRDQIGSGSGSGYVIHADVNPSESGVRQKQFIIERTSNVSGKDNNTPGYNSDTTSSYLFKIGGNVSVQEGDSAHASGSASHAEGIDTIASGDNSHAEGDRAHASGEASHAEGTDTSAVGNSSHAEGFASSAEGELSHAEGYSTQASGSASHAEGIDTVAEGDYSHAEGEGAEATGTGSHAEGRSTLASGSASHAEGRSTLASGNDSHAEGRSTLAEGESSHVEGSASIASKKASHAEGLMTTASGTGSHTEGYNTTASGDYSHAEGQNTTAFYMAHAEGYSTTASGPRAHAEGRLTLAEGESSHAEGYNAVATGDYSHTEGKQTDASGEASHAEGYSTTASGDYSHAEGSASIASGTSSHAEGQNTTASGTSSHAEGYSTTASGDYSHAEGSASIASRTSSHAEGYSTTASGDYSHAEGYSATAAHNGSHAEGWGTAAIGEASHAEGYLTTASGSYSHAEGDETTAFGHGSHAEGQHFDNVISFEYPEQDFNPELNDSTDPIINDFSSYPGYCIDSSYLENYLGHGIMKENNNICFWIRNDTSVEAINKFITYVTPGLKIVDYFCAQVKYLEDNNIRKYVRDVPTYGNYHFRQMRVNDDYKIVRVINEGIYCKIYTNIPFNFNNSSSQYEQLIDRYDSHCFNYHFFSLKIEKTGPHGNYSHTEGFCTNAMGNYSHADGYLTEALNEGEHACGILNESGYVYNDSGLYKVANEAPRIGNAEYVHRIMFSVGCGVPSDDGTYAKRMNSLMTTAYGDVYVLQTPATTGSGTATYRMLPRATTL